MNAISITGIPALIRPSFYLNRATHAPIYRHVPDLPTLIIFQIEWVPLGDLAVPLLCQILVISPYSFVDSALIIVPPPTPKEPTSRPVPDAAVPEPLLPPYFIDLRPEAAAFLSWWSLHPGRLNISP